MNPKVRGRSSGSRSPRVVTLVWIVVSLHA